MAYLLKDSVVHAAGDQGPTRRACRGPPPQLLRSESTRKFGLRCEVHVKTAIGFHVNPASRESAGNLTQLEYLALSSDHNVADGHARQALTPGQAGIVENLPAMFAEGEKRPIEELEREGQHAYLTLLGQHTYQAASYVLSCYSSSVAMEIFARSLVTRTDTVALVHPTFDNIADILRGVGLTLIPVAEPLLHEGDLDEDLLGSVGCLFITTPNNPTGRVLTESSLRRLAGQCAKQNVILALDTSFRGFDTRAHYDHYAVLQASGCRWLVIEDTGKLWPTLDLKVGMLLVGPGLDIPVSQIYSDILLGVSPLILVLVREFAADAMRGGLPDLHAFIATNRKVVRTGLAGIPGVTFPDLDSRVSVERVDVGARTGTDVWKALQAQNVYVLPCRPFHWADQSRGDHMVRVALARSAAPLGWAVRSMRSVLGQ